MNEAEILLVEIKKAFKRNLLYLLGGTALSGVMLYSLLSRKDWDE